MAKMQNPSSFFSGGGTISGDIELEGRFDLNRIVIGLGAEIVDGASAVGVGAKAIGNLHSAAFGKNSEATGGDATALGTEAKATNRWNTAVGYDAGSQNNGRNIVLVGREATALGDNGVAIGESSAADGDNSTAVGRGTQALGDDSSVFGQNSEVSGINSTVVGQGVTVDAVNAASVGTDVTITGDRAVGVGAGAEATGNDSLAFGESSVASGIRSTAVGAGADAIAENAAGVGVNAQATALNALALGESANASEFGATALGKNATASGVNSLALGSGSTVTRDNVFGFGDRDITLPEGRSFLYPENAGVQTIVDIPVTSAAVQGELQAYSFDIGGEGVFQIEGQADGAGGINNKVAKVLSSFDFRGASDSAVDIITGNISIRDSNGNEELLIDAVSDPPTIDFKNNRVESFGLGNGESLTFEPDAGAQRITDIPVNAASDNSEQSYTFAVGGNDIAKVIALGDGAGGVKEPEFQLLDILNASGNNIEDGSDIIYNASQTQIEQSILENSSLTYNAGDGLGGGGNVALGGSATFNIGAGNFITTNASSVEVNVGSGIEGDGSDNIQVRGDAVSDGFLSEGTNPHQISVNLGSGLEGDGTNNIRVSGDSVAGNVLSEGANPQEVDLNIGDGVVQLGDQIIADSDKFITVDAAGISVNVARGLEDDGTNNIRVNEDTAFDFTSLITVRSGLDTRGDIVDGVSTIYNSASGFIEQSILENDTVTVNATNGLSGGTVPLGGSTSIGISGALELDTDLETPTSDLIWDNANNYIPQPRLENDSITLTSGDGILSIGTVALGGTETISVDPDSFISTGPGGVSANIARGLVGDGSNNISVDETAAFDFSSEIRFGSGLNVNGNIRDGALTIYDSAQNEINQGALANSTVGVQTGNGLTGGDSSLALGNSITLSIPTDAIQTDELDESISPTFTGTHTFNGGISMGSNIDMGTNNTIVNVPSPNNAKEVANKAFVDGVASGLSIKASSRVATDGTSIDLTSSTDPSPVDGVTLSNGDRILLKDQANAVENGIYDAVTATDPSTWVRSSDFDDDSEVESGAFTFIREGTENESVSFTVTTGDPISVGTDEIQFAEFARAGEISEGTSINIAGQTISVDVPSLAGTGIEESANTLRIDSTSIGDGISGGSGSAINVVTSDFAGFGLIDDGTNDLRLDTPFTDLSVLVGSPISVGGQLNLGGDILGAGGTTTIYNSSSDHVPIAALESNSITINTTNGLSAGSVTLGDSLSIGISGAFTLDSDLNAVNGEIIWDETNSYIPQGRLEHDSIQLNAGNGLKGGSTAALGGSFGLDIEPADFAGAGLQDDGLDNIELVDDSITLSGGNGLKNGTTASLGGSFSLDVEPADFAGTFLQDDGADNLELVIGNGLANDGAGTLVVDTDNDFDFTSQIQFSAGLDSRGDIVDETEVIYDTSAGHVPSSILQATDITVSGNNGLSGGTASLGGSLSVGINGNLSLDSDLVALNGEVIWDESAGHIPQTSLENDSITINTTAVSLGSSISIALSDLAGFDLSGNSLSDGATTIYDATNGFVPTSTLEASSVTVNTGTGISGGGSPSLGGSGIDISLTNTDITINASNGLTGGTVSLGGSVGVGISGSLELDTDLVSNSSGSNQVIYDESAGELGTAVIPDPLSITTLTVNTIEDGGSDLINFNLSGTKRAQIDNSGNVDIEGELTEGAAL